MAKISIVVVPRLCFKSAGSHLLITCCLSSAKRGSEGGGAGWDERMGALFALPAYQPSQLPRWDGRAGRRMANIRPCGCAIEKYLQTPWPSAYRRRHWLSPQIGYRTPPCSRTPHGFPGRASVIRLFASFIPVPPAPDHHHRRGTGLPVSPFESWFHRLSNIAL